MDEKSRLWKVIKLYFMWKQRQGYGRLLEYNLCGYNSKIMVESIIGHFIWMNTKVSDGKILEEKSPGSNSKVTRRLFYNLSSSSRFHTLYL